MASWDYLDIFHINLQMPNTVVFCYIIAISLFSYILSVAVYNRFFHPLAKFPGPFLGAMTDWYLVYVICSVPTFGLELHKKYGMTILKSHIASLLTF